MKTSSGEDDVHGQSVMNVDEGTVGWFEFLENIDEYAVDTGIEDLAENHDHYLYGMPKRK